MSAMQYNQAMLSATPAAMTTKKLIPDATPGGIHSPSHMTDTHTIHRKGTKKKKDDRARTSSIVTGPKHLNPEFTGNNQKLSLSKKMSSMETP
jgi:hypothetical protein